MPNSSTICCDANVVVRLLARPEDQAVVQQWSRWRAEGRPLVAPVLLRFEVTNALHRLRRAGELTADEAADALRSALGLPITLRADDDLHAQAMEVAARLNLVAAYDAHYLALAERLGIEFWTADERLYNAVRHQLPWVHFIVP